MIVQQLVRFLLLFSFSTLAALQNPLPDALHFNLGPQVYHASRIRKGGTEQKGLVSGIAGTIERRKPNAIYVGIEGYFGEGMMKGYDGRDRVLYSYFDEAKIEGRAGYAIIPFGLRRATFIPYLGYGFFWGRNALKPPSPLNITFFEHFNYLAAGFLSRYQFQCGFTMGIDLLCQFGFEGSSTVSHDPLYGTQRLQMGDGRSFELDLPVGYCFCFNGYRIESHFTPFYRFRLYEGRENYPFDFIEMRFHNWGVKWLFGVVF